MSVAEVASWREFYRAFPFDDLHRYHRPAALVARSMSSSATIQDLLQWLAPDPSLVGVPDADLATMRAFGFTSKG